MLQMRIPFMVRNITILLGASETQGCLLHPPVLLHKGGSVVKLRVKNETLIDIIRFGVVMLHILKK